MPSNEAADKVHNFFDHENLSGSPNQSQVGSSNWQGLNNNLWPGNQRQFGTVFGSNPPVHNVQYQNSGENYDQSPQNPAVTNLTHLSLRPEVPRNQSGDQQSNVNGFMHVNRGLQLNHNKALRENTVADMHNIPSRGGYAMTESQQGNAPDHNPNLTRKSEIAEAPVGFDFLGGQQQHMRDQQSGMQQSMMPLWQQQIMLKQIQDLQKQQHLQQMDQEARQQHNQMSQLPTMINGNPVRNSPNSYWPSEGVGGESYVQSSPQMFITSNMNWAQQRGGSGSPAMQGIPNGTFSNEQGRQFQSMGFGSSPQQLNQSLYGSPVAGTRGDLNQYIHLQGVPHDRAAMYTKGQQLHKSMMQSAPVSNSFQGDQGAIYQDQIQGKNTFGHAQVQASNTGTPRNFPPMNSTSRSPVVQGFHGMQEQSDWSHSSQERLESQVGHSQGFSSLDPVAEKIILNSSDNTDFGTLFGFGGTDQMSSFPSLQSGSWSALMQSAVAESSSSDTGVQDEWSGLSTVDNNLHSSIPFSTMHDSNMNPVGTSMHGFQQSERSEASHESLRQSPKESITWLDQSLQQKQSMDGNHQVQSPVSRDFPSQNAWAGQSFDQSGNAEHPTNSEAKFQNAKGSWVNRQNIPLFSMDGKPFQKPNGRNISETQSPGGDSPLRHQNENVFYHSNSMPHSVGLPKQSKPGQGSPQIKHQFNQEMNQQEPNNHHLEYAKNIHSPTNFKGYDHLGQYQNQENANLQVLESHINNFDRGGDKHVSRLGSNHQKETSSDSYNSNQSHHTVSGGSGRQNSWLSGSDSKAVASASQKSMSQVAQKPSAPPRMFQYHPMGNLEVNLDPPNTTKPITHLDSLQQQGSRGVINNELRHFGNSKSVNHFPDQNIDMEKQNVKGSEELHHRGIAHEHVSGSSDRLAGRGPEHSSQNMLELLHKVDQPREHINLRDFGSNVRQSSPPTIPEPAVSETSLDHPPQNQSSTQGFGLRLAPPSQRQPPNHSIPQNFQQILSNLNSSHVNSEMRLKSQMQSLPGDVCERERLENISKVSRANADEVSHQRNLLQNQQASNASRQVPSTDSVNTPILRNSSQQQQMVLESVSVSQPSVLSGRNHPGIFPKVMQNVWNNVSIQQRVSQKEPETLPWVGKHQQDDQGIARSGNQPSEVGGCYVTSQQQKRESSGKAVVDPQCIGTLQEKERSLASVPLTDHTHSQELDRGGYAKNSTQIPQAEHTLANPSSSNSDIQAFGRYLRPSHGFQKSLSLLQQVQAMKGIESDVDLRGGKRFIGPDAGLDTQNHTTMTGNQHGLNRMVGEVVRSEQNSVPQRMSFQPGDAKVLSFSSRAREDQNINSSSHHVFADLPPRDVPGNARNNYDIHPSHSIASSTRAEHHQIRPSMAPSWFEQFGTFKNNQMLQISNAGNILPQKFIPGSPAEYATARSLMERISASSASEAGKAEQSDTTLFTTEPTSSIGDEDIQRSPILETKKRKNISTELLPWHKEISHGSQRLQNLSTAEQDWAHATNRIIEKMEDDAEFYEDGQVFRPRRRLISSTQLMQQIFGPAPPAILSMDSTSDYDSLTYFHAKLALGYACSLISCSESDECVSPDSAKMTTVKPSTTERIKQHYSKVAEDYIDRAKKLESDLLRLDKRASVLDVRLECQDLERFSCINRFVKFHGRGNADGTESSSTSGVAVNIQRQYPQRYVIAHAMPRNLPDGVQCVSL